MVKELSINRMTIRESKMVDLARMVKLLQDDGYVVHVNGHYLVFYKKGSYTPKEGVPCV